MNQKIHSCFISYRHPASIGGREEKIIKHVYTAIKEHVEVYTHEYGVYFDEHRLVPGYQYDERLAQAICQSACMVVVYWPSYLESEYCMKELRTMLSIEEERRSLLTSELHGCRLFIPIILRGRFEDLPTEVRIGCQYLDYSAQSTLPNFNIGDDPKMSEQLFQIAEYVKTLCDKMKNFEDKLFKKCTEFYFPLSYPPQPSLSHRQSVQRFPGR
jgi:hypothetical protein